MSIVALSSASYDRVEPHFTHSCELGLDWNVAVQAAAACQRMSSRDRAISLFRQLYRAAGGLPTVGHARICVHPRAPATHRSHTPVPFLIFFFFSELEKIGIYPKAKTSRQRTTVSNETLAVGESRGVRARKSAGRVRFTPSRNGR